MLKLSLNKTHIFTEHISGHQSVFLAATKQL